MQAIYKNFTFCILESKQGLNFANKQQVAVAAPEKETGEEPTATTAVAKRGRGRLRRCHRSLQRLLGCHRPTFLACLRCGYRVPRAAELEE